MKDTEHVGVGSSCYALPISVFGSCQAIEAVTRRGHLQVTDTYSTNCVADGETCSSFTVESDKFYGPVVTADATAAPAAFQGLDWTVSA